METLVPAILAAGIIGLVAWTVRHKAPTAKDQGYSEALENLEWWQRGDPSPDWSPNSYDDEDE